jgi:hypothetical protein
MAHWSQAVRNPARVMAKYDYGTSCTTWLGLPQDCNQRKYGSSQPPQYNLSAITTPLALFTGELVAFFKAVDLGSYNGKRLQDHPDMKRFFENGIGKNTFGVSLFNVFGNVHKLRNNSNSVTLSAKERTLISGALDSLRAKKVAEGKSVDVANLDAGQLQNKDYMSILSFYKNKTAKPEALAPFSADVMRMVELTGELNDKYRAELKEKRPKVKVVREKPTTPARKSPKAAPAPAAKGKATASKIAPVAAPAPAAAKPSVASPGKGKAAAKR